MNVLRHASATSTAVDFNPVRLRRAPVLLARIRPPGRFSDANTVGSSSRNTTRRRDDLELVRPEALADSFFKVLAAFAVARGESEVPQHEPRGRAPAGQARPLPPDGRRQRRKMTSWPCSGCSTPLGRTTDLLEIATRAGLSLRQVSRSARALAETDLLREAEPGRDDRAGVRAGADKHLNAHGSPKGPFGGMTAPPSRGKRRLGGAIAVALAEAGATVCLDGATKIEWSEPPQWLCDAAAGQNAAPRQLRAAGRTGFRRRRVRAGHRTPTNVETPSTSPPRPARCARRLACVRFDTLSFR